MKYKTKMRVLHVEHLFLKCVVVKKLWTAFFKLCNLNVGQQDSVKILILNSVDQGKSTNQKKFLEAALGSILWLMWKARNDVLFNNKIFRAQSVMNDLQASLFNWISYRSKCTSLSWEIWCCNQLSSF